MKLITIIGPSGAGKDTAARILSEITGIPVLVSYTTRPMREGEVNGREHHFVTECTCPKDQMLAYTEYGGYEYWVSLDQLQAKSESSVQGVSLCEAGVQGVSLCEAHIYVIDEEGLRDIRNRFPDINITTVYIRANKHIRRMRGVTEERMKRDDLREQFPLEAYDFRISNNRDFFALATALAPVANNIQHNVLQTK